MDLTLLLMKFVVRFLLIYFLHAGYIMGFFYSLILYLGMHFIGIGSYGIILHFRAHACY